MCVTFSVPHRLASIAIGDVDLSAIGNESRAPAHNTIFDSHSRNKKVEQLHLFSGW